MDVPGGATAADSLFLPDFCAIGTLFTVVLVGQLLVFVLVLTAPGEDWLGELAMSSLFVQWVVLASSGLLCIGRRVLRPLGDAAAGVAAWSLVLVVTVVVGEAAWWYVQEPAALLRAAGQGERISHLHFQFRNVAISAIIGALALRYFYIQHQWKRRVQGEARARFQALQARIRPHFLFNSMNTIASLARSRPDIAEQVVEDLSDLFRASLADESAPATLGRELELCREYVRIETERLGERLHADWRLDGLPADALLPPLTLQPLVENAVYHGIEPLADGGTVSIDVTREGERIVITIENPVGTSHTRNGNRMAQANVSERLAAFFGPGAKFEAGGNAGRYRVRLAFPYRTA